MLSNVPAELRAYNSFVLWRYEERGMGKPTKVPYSTNGYPASIHKPQHWSDFDSAVRAFEGSGGYYAGVGFVLSANDPFTFIDLDDPNDPTKNYTNDERSQIRDRQILIQQMFDSYSEVSPSGTGLHIICKGSVEEGRKRGQIELYSTERFMTVTGLTYDNKPIADRSDLVQTLWSEMSNGAASKVYSSMGDMPQVWEDDRVLEVARGADNGAKFIDLFTGAWEHHYSSHSEADLALINMLAFYTQNRQQITRLFRMSGLGQRDKAYRDDYVNYNINRSFDRQLPPVDIEGLKASMDAALAAKQAADAQEALMQQQAMSATQEQQSQQQQYGNVQPQSHGEEFPVKPRKKEEFQLPPGLLGDMTKYIYESSIRPVWEISLVSAISLMSGICGRCYNVSGTGLNQYTLIIGATGVGKEELHKGLDRLCAAVSMFQPKIKEFIGPGEIASPQALAKHFHRSSKSFVAMPGEIGILMQMWCSTIAPPAMTGIKRMLLQLYNSSGHGQILKESINSQKENSTDQVKSPAMSLAGESTPEEFYKVLDEDMVRSGLLPRFTIFEYKGPRPKRNRNAGNVQVPNHITQSLSLLVVNALTLNDSDQVINVGYTDEALRMMDQWDEFCDVEINGAEAIGGDYRKALWNRGHMKALKLAALVAVGNNPYAPVIDAEIAEWSLKIIYNDIMQILRRFDIGEVGNDSAETRQINDMAKQIVHYLTSPASMVTGIKVNVGMHAERIIPYNFLHTKLVGASSYKNDRQGSTTAVKKVLQILVDRGDLREIPKADCSTRFGSSTRAFMVSNPKAFGL